MGNAIIGQHTMCLHASVRIFICFRVHNDVSVFLFDVGFLSYLNSYRYIICVSY